MPHQRGCRRSVRCWGCPFVVCLLVSIASVASAQDTTEPSLKSAVIFNMAKFTTWPENVLPGNADFVACIVGSQAVEQALQRTVKSRRLGSHPIQVSQRDIRDPQASFRTCHLLYINGLQPKQLAPLLTELRGTAVLTIIDVEDPTSSLGIAELFVENGRMRFQLNNGLAKQGRLELSSGLLSLASRVLENPAVTR